MAKKRSSRITKKMLEKEAEILFATKKPKKPHRAKRSTCKWCGLFHSTSQHLSHGIGSFNRTHR